MRITSGRYRGRTLTAPTGQTTRPTSDRARQALFNILIHASWSPFADGATPHVADLFAGSGALGFEALSHGAAFCLFVEVDAAARGAIRTTADALGVMGHTRIHRRDATDLGPKPAGMNDPFDLVFLDPPYHKGLGEQALACLVAGAWLKPGAILVFECSADETPDVAGFEHLDERIYGAAKVLFLQWHGPSIPHVSS